MASVTTNFRARNYCTTTACIEIASNILLSLALNYTMIDPCTDFRRLACAGWDAKHTAEAGQGRAAFLGDIYNSAWATSKDILEGPYPTGSDAGFLTKSLSQEEAGFDKDNFNLIVKTYNACMNSTAVKAAGLRPLLDFIDRIVDTFPVAHQTGDKERMISEADAPKIGKTLLLFNQHGITTFETIDVGVDDQNTPLLVGPQAQNNQIVKEYLRIMAAVLQQLHPGSLGLSDAQRLALTITEFEKGAADLQAMNDIGAGDASRVRKFKLEEVTGVAPELDHDYILKNLIPDNYEPSTLVFSPAYFGNLSRLLQNSTLETIQGFFIWKAASTFSGLVESEVMEQLNSMKEKLRGNDLALSGKVPRWQVCVRHVDEGVSRSILPVGLGWILGRFYADKAYSNETRKLTANMLGTIQQAFKTRLKDKDWLTLEVRKIAQEKVDAIVAEIGYPTWSTDPQKVAEYFSTLNIGNTYFENALALATFSSKMMWAQLSRPIERNTWPLTPLTLNAGYEPTSNAIFVTTSIQQQPFYNVEYPSYINYGGLGSILGHEVTHGLDNLGHRYAANGSLVDWWDEQSLQGFENRTNCFIDQYKKSFVTAPDGTQVHIRANASLGENIADAGGVATSYAAWKKLQADDNAQDFDLPGLEGFSHDQLFFVKWAQTHCEKSASKEHSIYLVYRDEHPPAFARILGSLDNSREFRSAFNCPQKQPTCELW
ncbi:Endothelin-converting enzyme 1-like protein 2 [Colletotrichum chlorophyti]|uniref:Endothelin-converting enzyme 1-like protein 2 n=1 Tax=Colletotrichum chlorophyti TaxID=708187 RepID=A0A1Q8RNT8_9PEZI|nr:Endothelin-converting enzyme 1-like protein 2 [Colletotrichum chlorophyti]